MVLRLWTLHPRYLDAKGLVALWREALLAQRVLEGRTRGYRHHPQLIRFASSPDPRGSVAAFLLPVAEEAARRGYRFDRNLIGHPPSETPICTTEGQLLFEWNHLREKLAKRDPEKLEELERLPSADPHPLFVITPGGIEPWERKPGPATERTE